MFPRHSYNILLNIPLLNIIIIFIYRILIASKYLLDQGIKVFLWLINSKETTNFTYDLDEINKKYLASFIANVTKKELVDIKEYFNEIDNDENFYHHIINAVRNDKKGIVTDLDVKLGRRIGWYSLVRALKPKVIIETGVDKGLGACVIISALIKNSSEGFEGHYYGTDINPAAGFLIKGEFAKFGGVIYGDSVESLLKFNKPIDLFINDSNHSSDYEWKEYETIKNKLSKNAIIISDNSHSTDKLYKFAQKTNRKFLFFQEKPSKHWYPGAGIGIAFKRKD